MAKCTLTQLNLHNEKRLNADLVAENAELRQQLHRLRLDMVKGVTTPTGNGVTNLVTPGASSSSGVPIAVTDTDVGGVEVAASPQTPTNPAVTNAVATPTSGGTSCTDRCKDVPAGFDVQAHLRTVRKEKNRAWYHANKERISEIRKQKYADAKKR
eukprot:8567799-Pyramimonas_sp.AAC.1